MTATTTTTSPFKNHAFLNSLRQLTIEIEERTVGAFHTLQQQTFDKKAEQFAITKEEEEEEKSSTFEAIATKSCDKNPSTHSMHVRIPTKFEIRALFHLWNHALQNGDAEGLTGRYHDDHTTLLAHDVDYPLQSKTDIREYFQQQQQEFQQSTHFMSCRILEGSITVDERNGRFATDSGILELRTKSKKSARTTTTTSTVQRLRYCFFYTLNHNGKWKIQHQHMSIMPSAVSESNEKECTKTVKTPEMMSNSTTNADNFAPTSSNVTSTTPTSNTRRTSIAPHRRESEIQQLALLLMGKQLGRLSHYRTSSSSRMLPRQSSSIVVTA